MHTRTTGTFSQELFAQRQARALVLPSKTRVARFADDLLALLFPHFSDERYREAAELDVQMQVLLRDLRTVLLPLAQGMRHPVDVTAAMFAEQLPAISAALWHDAEAITSGDPAAESIDEVISAYPGFLAIALHRVAHQFYQSGVPIFPRILSERAHHRSGIDIHPGARIGRSFCIDHGTGIVIGETSVIGDHVKIYQGVTLGALSVEKSLARSKRHPTIEDRVVLYSNATILGGETVVGHDSVIGGNVWLTQSVPPHSVVYHKSEVKVRDARGDPKDIDFII
jgi:serine O-acetyltransferase